MTEPAQYFCVYHKRPCFCMVLNLMLDIVESTLTTCIIMYNFLMLKFRIGNDLFQLSDMLEYFEHITNWGSGLKIRDALYMIISY